MLTDEEAMHLIRESFQAFLFGLILTIPILIFAWKKGFFQKLTMKEGPIRGLDVLKAFGALILVQMLLIPGIAALILVYKNGIDFFSMPIDKSLIGWIDIMTILAGFIGTYAVFFSLPLSSRSYIWGPEKSRTAFLMMGCVSWLIIYPFVVTVSQLLNMLVLYLFHQSPIDQVAVRHIKGSADTPLLFIATFIGVITLVPLVEELLFRGLLQSWLRMKFRQPWIAILIASLVFTAFHFSTSQGITNIELMTSLFILSCFIGYLYEKTHSLWTSIGLHATFNAINITLIMFI